jgi:hypothetical protein
VTVQEQIAKLESLLERIRRNAAAPRPAAVRAAPAPVAPVRIAEPPAAPEEVSLESIGATEAQPQAEPLRERVQSADMEELEVVELGEVVELSPGDTHAASGDIADTLEEPVPESAPRAAVQSVEVELEPPVKTPPPESGRQAVTPPPAIAESRPASADDFDEDDLLEPDRSGSPIPIVSPGSPTMAQLGDTVPLEGTSPSTAAADLELHSEVKPEPSGVAPSRRVDPLAATVPDLRTALSLAQTAPDLRSPFADAVRATTEAIAEEQPKVEAKAEPAAPAAATAPQLVVERPAITAPHAAEVVVEKPRKVPETFLDLLDESLSLRG